MKSLVEYTHNGLFRCCKSHPFGNHSSARKGDSACMSGLHISSQSYSPHQRNIRSQSMNGLQYNRNFFLAQNSIDGSHKTHLLRSLCLNYILFSRTYNPHIQARLGNLNPLHIPHMVKTQISHSVQYSCIPPNPCSQHTYFLKWF